MNTLYWCFVIASLTFLGTSAYYEWVLSPMNDKPKPDSPYLFDDNTFKE